VDPDCLACRVNSGEEPVPGGVIAETVYWRADHCIGSFGVGAVVLKTKEHVEDFWAITPEAAAELGPFASQLSRAIVDGLGAERVYLTMWVDKPPHHVHLVLYPRYPGEQRRALDLQVALQAAGPPVYAEAARAAELLRTALDACEAGG
jgi:diadenosine tetraphosphate (Ap4A) HIT family hydrolase